MVSGFTIKRKDPYVSYDFMCVMIRTEDDSVLRRIKIEHPSRYPKIGNYRLIY